MLFLAGNNAGRIPQDGSPINCSYLRLESEGADSDGEQSAEIHAQLTASSLGCIGCGGEVQVAYTPEKKEAVPPRACPLFGLEYHRP